MALRPALRSRVNDLWSGHELRTPPGRSLDTGCRWGWIHHTRATYFLQAQHPTEGAPKMVFLNTRHLGHRQCGRAIRRERLDCTSVVSLGILDQPAALWHHPRPRALFYRSDAPSYLVLGVALSRGLDWRRLVHSRYDQPPGRTILGWSGFPLGQFMDSVPHYRWMFRDTVDGRVGAEFRGIPVSSKLSVPQPLDCGRIYVRLSSWPHRTFSPCWCIVFC